MKISKARRKRMIPISSGNSGGGGTLKINRNLFLFSTIHGGKDFITVRNVT